MQNTKCALLASLFICSRVYAQAPSSDPPPNAKAPLSQPDLPPPAQAPRYALQPQSQSPPPATTTASSLTPPPTPSRLRLAIGLGFSHWFGPTVGSPDGYTTPMFAIGVRPYVRFLELRVRYTISSRAITFPSGRTHLGFGGLTLRVGHELRVGRHSLHVFAGPELFLSHDTDRRVAMGWGFEGGAEWLIRTGARLSHAVGIFFTAHEVLCRLPGEGANFTRHPHRDAQIDIGVVTTLF